MPFEVRPGSADEASLLLDLFDASVAWQVEHGFSAQWGTEPFSQSPTRVATCGRWAAGGGFHVCEADGRPAAALVLGEAPDYVPAADEPELYVVVLVGSHDPATRGAGAHLLGFAEDQARRRGITRVRVDCFAGNDGALVGYYERCGFRRAGTFEVNGWPGQVLERRLAG